MIEARQKRQMATAEDFEIYVDTFLLPLLRDKLTDTNHKDNQDIREKAHSKKKRFY